MAHKTSIFMVLLLAFIGTSNLVYAAEQKDFYGIWFYNRVNGGIAKKYQTAFFEINKDSINVFAMNYSSRTALKYKYRIVKWKKNDVNEYSLHTLSENNSEGFFRVYIESGEYDMYIDNGYTEGNGTKKSSAEELNKAIRNIKEIVEDTPPKKVAEVEVKPVAPIVPITKAKVKDSTYISPRVANAYKTISKVEGRRPATEMKISKYAFDFRDGKTYKIIKIGSQTWMTENLNYDAKDSQCYENNESYCQKYGRLYNWITAKTACPAGWHLPTEAEWTQLTKSAGSDVFSALSGGLGILARGHYNFRAADYRGNWWSATDYTKGAYVWNINLDDAGVYKTSNDKNHLFSARCVQD
jgi:hypothetical protein